MFFDYIDLIFGPGPQNHLSGPDGYVVLEGVEQWFSAGGLRTPVGPQNVFR